MSNGNYDYIFDEFETMCPWAIKDMVDWEPGDEQEIIAHMRDGSVVLYDYVLKVFMWSPSLDELRRRRQATSEEEWSSQFAFRLHRMMKLKGVDQTTLSYESGISQGMISRYTNGLSIPNAWTVNRFAKVLGCTSSDLVDFD